MNSIPKVSLEDTLMLLQMVRETALSKGREGMAKQLTPIMNEMQEIVTTARSQPAAPPARGDVGSEEFRPLLEASQAKDASGQSDMNAVMERNRLIQAMAGGGMEDIEIARQFAITREEVRLVLSIQKNGSTSVKGIS